MNPNFKTWLVEEYGLQESAAISRAANISTIERYYGDIDTLVKNGGIDNLLIELSYTTDDERNNRPQNHKVPIQGNVRNGSATLKQAVNRYIEFYDATCRVCDSNDGLNHLFGQVKSVLDDFKPSKIQSSYSSKGEKEVKNFIQVPLLEKLKHAIPTVKWNMEVKLSDEVDDSVDILGEVDEETLVVIEIDTHRNDQICKKFVSRQALTDDKNTIYIVVTYPNDNCMGKYEKNALKKYEKYMNSLVQLLAQGSNLDKCFYLRQLL